MSLSVTAREPHQLSDRLGEIVGALLSSHPVFIQVVHFAAQERFDCGCMTYV